MNKLISMTGIFFIAAALAPLAYSQDGVTATVPVSVNVAATVRIQPPAGSGGVAVEHQVEAGVPKDFVLTMNEVASVRHGAVRQSGRPGVVNFGRGNVSLNLSSRSYQNAAISLYTLSGKRVLRGNAKAREGAFSVSRQNIAKGVYILAVNGSGGNKFSTRLTHNGGKLNINVAFDGGGAPSLSKQADAAGAAAYYGRWTIIATAPGRIGKSETFEPSVGGNPQRDITLEASNDWSVDVSWVPSDACEERDAGEGLDGSSDDLGLMYGVKVKYNDGAAPTVEPIGNMDGYLEYTVNGEHVVITKYTINITQFDGKHGIIVSGKTQNGSLRINRGAERNLFLNGVSITNPNGPAINIRDNKSHVILVGGCDRRNYLEGKGIDPVGDEQAKGAFFSEKTLEFKGNGMLEMRSRDRHAIVTDENIRIFDGNIVIHYSAGDGLHANNDIEIKGGKLQILSAGDAIQSERDDDKTVGVTITGGEVTIRTIDAKSHGIAAEEDIYIYGNPVINITCMGAASKGLRARRDVNIQGGTLNVFTIGDQIVLTPEDDDYDEADPTSSAAGIKAAEFSMSGGTYATVNRGKNSKGINVDLATISGGILDVRAHGDGIKVKGNLVITAPAEVSAESSDDQAFDVDGATQAQPGTIKKNESDSGAI